MDHTQTQSSSPFAAAPPQQQHLKAEQQAEDTTLTTTSNYRLFLKLISKRRTWVCLFILIYGLLLSSSWNLLHSILTWYRSYPSRSAGASSQALYASLMLGAVFGFISMAAVLAVALPSILVTWITILVLLTFSGKRRRLMVVEGRKISGEIARFVVRVLVKKGNLVAAFCAVCILCGIEATTTTIFADTLCIFSQGFSSCRE